MASKDNNNISDNDPFAKIDPVNWMKGQKIVFGDASKIMLNPENNRISLGSEFYGVKATVDAQNLGALAAEIRRDGFVKEPVWVFVNADGTEIVKRGNRRIGACKLLLADPTISPELRKALTERLPVIRLTNLNEQQQLDLVDDQTQQKYLRSEVVKLVFDQRKAGKNYSQIRGAHWVRFSDAFSDGKLRTELHSISDPQIRDERMKTGFRGSMDCYLIWAYDLGPWMRKQVMLSEMLRDKLVQDGTEMPFFKTDKNSQKRVAALKKAKEVDQAAGKWDAYMPLSVDGEFKKVAEKFRKEDYAQSSESEGGNEPKKMLTRDKINGMKDSFQSSAVKMILLVILGEEAPDLVSTDEWAALMESKRNVVLKYLPQLPVEMAALLRLCFVNDDPSNLDEYLAGKVETVDTAEVTVKQITE